MAEQPRGEFRSYVAATKTGPFLRLGDGFSSMSSNLNPQEKTTTYINDKTSTVTTGFQPEWPIEGNIYTGDPANKLLYDLAWKRAKGDNAVVYLVQVKHWESGTAANSFEAYLQQCSFSPASDGGGAGGEDNVFSGSLKAKGDATYGEAVITVDADTGFETCVFTETEE